MFLLFIVLPKVGKFFLLECQGYTYNTSNVSNFKFYYNNNDYQIINKIIERHFASIKLSEYLRMKFKFNSKYKRRKGFKNTNSVSISKRRKDLNLGLRVDNYVVKFVVRLGNYIVKLKLKSLILKSWVLERGFLVSYINDFDFDLNSNSKECIAFDNEVDSKYCKYCNDSKDRNDSRFNSKSKSKDCKDCGGHF